MLAHLQDPELSKTWLVGYWPGLPLCFGAGYLLMVFSSKQWMKDRAPIKPKIPLVAWNTALAVFSIVAFVQFAPSALLSELRNGGFLHSVCLVKPFSTPTLTLWSTLFVLSKIVEFGDTLFLTLRKAPLTFLHVWHHLTVAVYAWFGGVDRSSLIHWFIAMNLAVHAIMYTYFTLKGFGVNIPSFLAQVITSLQLAQFAMSLLCIVVAGVSLWFGEECYTTKEMIVFSSILYGSYLLLFLNFFYRRYIAPKRKKIHHQ
jgi:hypothetical protein